MGDILSTGVSGLLAFQRALDVTSNNIANVSTPGYSVQSANMAEQQPMPTASGYIGNGVNVASVTRSYDEALALQVRQSQSAASSSESFAAQAGLVDNLLSDPSNGLSATLQKFSNSLQSLATSPSSLPQRQALLGQAQALAQKLQGYDAQLTQYRTNLESQIGTGVVQINSIASGIAKLNAQIAAGIAGTGQTPNALLDQRDALLDQLSQYVGVSTSSQPDGQLNVFIGTGQPLVTGSIPQTLTTIPDPYDSTRHDIALTGGSGVADISSQITGGSLGGLMAVRSQVLDPAQNALGRISLTVATVLNAQQANGIDLNGLPGQPLFGVGGPQSLGAASNKGSATVSAALATPALASLGALTTDDYRLSFDGTNWSLTDLGTGQSVTLGGGPGGPFTAAGLSISVSGSATAGDSWLVRPTAAATQGMSVLLSSPTQIAAALPVQVAAGTTNTGSVAVSLTRITNPADPQLTSTATISFGAGSPPASYSINGGASVAWSPGQPIAANGWSLSLTGVPSAGDTLTVSRNTSPTGDNRNALAMAAALTAPTLDAASTSLTAAAGNLVSQVGVSTQQAQTSATVQQGLNQEAVTARNNVSGVNLDEEAAHLLAYQQAYQACAQVIQASNTLFNALITAVRG